AFARVLVPLYFLAGAVLKIIDASPTHLPTALIKWAGAAGIDLVYLLRLAIAGELAVVGVMILVPRLARPVGLCLLGVFLPVLIGDLMLGASSCGCFGAVEVSPWATLVVDVGLFLGLFFFGRRNPALAWTSTLPTIPTVVAGFWVVTSFMVGFTVNGGSTPHAPSMNGASVNGGVAELPAEGFYFPDYGSWIGSSWEDVPLSVWVQDPPPDLNSGLRYVMFYRKDCEHCHELMEAWFADFLPAPTLAVAIPERGGFPTENLMSFRCDDCQFSELPSGIDWFMQTPVLVRLRDGYVECAAEVQATDPQCIEF
ncbi:MAG: hypothetical protein K8R59_10220, partial [Thermoanaerobaculales bacterium]|nr:hypothetical protein [Thermoanaerobaculales bacterium]